MSCPSCYNTNKTSCDICGFKTVVTNIYILECVDKKYYIGKTNNPEFRLEKHFSNNGSAWTKKYPPIRVIEIIPNSDDYDEDKHTLKYMKQYGINNVRGGSFCQLILDEEHINTINRMINGSNDKCYKCGSNNHFANYCNVSNQSKKLKCDRCERVGHTIDDCYASTDKNGEELIEYVEVYCCSYCGKEFETEKGARFHENVHCNMKHTKTSSKNKCFRCGRDNHYADNCYASKHINGKVIDN